MANTALQSENRVFTYSNQLLLPFLTCSYAGSLSTFLPRMVPCAHSEFVLLTLSQRLSWPISVLPGISGQTDHTLYSDPVTFLWPWLPFFPQVFLLYLSMKES